MQPTNAVKVLQAVLEKMADRIKIVEKSSIYRDHGYATAKAYCEHKDEEYGLLMDLVDGGRE